MSNNCLWVSTDQPRIIGRRHLDPCECDGERGCTPCPETHCVVCGRAHAAVTCPGCLEAARSDLRAIGDLCSALPEEAQAKGVDSEAMMLLGPASDPEAWRNRATSAMLGRLPAEYLEDARDELHPLWVMGTWEQIWRDHLDHQTEAPVTLSAAWAYLDMQMAYMADQPEPAFEEFAREIRACRSHLEDVLMDGIREERGAPCLQCKTRMTRIITKEGAQDTYRCKPCRREVSADQYHYAVGVVYREHSPHLTAVDLGNRLGIKPSMIRVWGARGLIRKHGRTAEGLTLYDVADVRARLDNPETEKAG